METEKLVSRLLGTLNKPVEPNLGLSSLGTQFLIPQPEIKDVSEPTTRLPEELRGLSTPALHYHDSVDQ